MHEIELPCVKIRNQGTKPIFIDEVGLLRGDERISVSFTNFNFRPHRDSLELPAGHSRVFDLRLVKIAPEVLGNFTGLYLITGTGHEFFDSESDFTEIKKLLGMGNSSKPLRI